MANPYSPVKVRGSSSGRIYLHVALDLVAEEVAVVGAQDDGLNAQLGKEADSPDKLARILFRRKGQVCKGGWQLPRHAADRVSSQNRASEAVAELSQGGLSRKLEVQSRIERFRELGDCLLLGELLVVRVAGKEVEGDVGRICGVEDQAKSTETIAVSLVDIGERELARGYLLLGRLSTIFMYGSTSRRSRKKLSS